jgi:hypothetical protein
LPIMDVPHLPHLLLRPLNVVSMMPLPAWHTLGPVPNQRALPKQAATFIETMDCLPVAKLPHGPQWTYEILCNGPHKISCVAQEVMLRNSCGSAHLLAGALRARNIISSQRQTPFTPTSEDNDCRQPASDCFAECFALFATVEIPSWRPIEDHRHHRWVSRAEATAYPDSSS